MVIRNTFIIFLVSGFWHGANWTFILWGAYHAFLFLPLILLGRNRKYTDSVAENRLLPNIKEFFQMGITFLLAVFGWIIFRAENIHHFWSFISKIFSPSLFTMPYFKGCGVACLIVLLIGIFVVIEWFGRKDKYALEKLGLNWKPVLRYCMYYILIIIIFFFAGEEQQFIYFQF